MNNQLHKLPVHLHSLTPIQVKYLHDWKHRFFVLPPGRRSRKTLLSARKVLLEALRNPDKRYFHAAPTRQQAKSIFWKRLKTECDAFIKGKPNETDLFITLLNGTEIHVVGLDNPKRIEGQPWHGCHLSEFDDYKHDAWESNIRPVLSDTNGFAILDGVPEGRGNLYEKALYACDNAIPETLPNVGAFYESKVDPEWCYYHWFSSDVLPPAEIEAARRELDPKIFKQEYEGSFEGFDGLAYYAFSHKNIVDKQPLNPKKEIIIAMDFNYDPMCSVALQENEYGDPTVIEAFAFSNCDTDAACDRIIDFFGDEHRYIIYADASAKNRSAHGAGKTDLIMIQQAFSRCKSFWVRVKPANPKRKDRLNAVNGMLQNSAGESRLKIAKHCLPLIRDFQKVTMEEFLNGNFSDPNLGHITDALGYFIEYKYPIKRSGNVLAGLTT